MGNSRELRHGVAGILILVLIIADTVAAWDTFQDWLQVILLISLLVTTTFLAIIFHLRCRKYAGRMVIYRKMLNTYYAAFIGIGLLSFCYILLPEVTGSLNRKALLTAAYLIVIALGVPLAIRSLIGIKDQDIATFNTPPQADAPSETDPDEPPSQKPGAGSSEAEDSESDNQEQGEKTELQEPVHVLSEAAQREQRSFEKLQGDQRTEERLREFETLEKRLLTEKRRSDFAGERRVRQELSEHLSKTDSDK